MLDAAIAEAQARRRAQQHGHRPLPSSAPVELMVPVPEDAEFDDMDFEDAPLAIHGLHGQAGFVAYPTEPPEMERFNAFPMVPTLPGGHPSPAETGVASEGGCQHLRTTKRGSNGPEGEGDLLGL